jgi:hypothetical protein
MEASMRGCDLKSEALFSYVNLEARIPETHPLRKIREIVNAALARMDGDFAVLYADEGRPSIAPERLLRAALIQILFSIRSERQLMEQMQYNLLFRGVRWAWHRRSGLGANGFYQEPRPFADHGYCPQVSRRDPGGKGVGATPVRGTFLRGRHAGGSLGLDEEFPAEG